MDLKHLLSQTNIKINHKSEPEPEPEPELEPEPENEYSPHSDNESDNDSDHDLNNKNTEPRFLVAWNKLEKGSKMNRIIQFIESEKVTKELSTNQSNDLKQLLFRACDMGLFNKLSDVKYDSELGIIESFKHLEFNESSKKYKLKTGGSKSRSVTKSRSNIDRLMNKR